MTADGTAEPAAESVHRDDSIACPGCGLELPGGAEPAGGRRNASAACWQVYGRVLAHESENLLRLGRLHQLTVDAYGSQHAGGATPSIGVAFGLIGLKLTLEDGWTGLEVRDAHQYLGQRYRDWPRFDPEPPPRVGELTVLDVAAAGSPEAHEELVVRWASSVWSSWSRSHEAVEALIAERLPPEVQARIRAVARIDGRLG